MHHIRRHVARFYQGYVSFFSKQVSEKGAAGTLEEFVFSEKYNYQKGRDANTQPEMLSHLFQGLVHPMIHVGYGCEFGLKGMLVEGAPRVMLCMDEYSKSGFQGLALTAVQALRVRGSLSASLFSPSSTDVVEHITHRISSFALDAPTSPIISKTGGVHAFDIVARILKDDTFKPRDPADFLKHFPKILAEYSPTIRAHAEQWTVDLNQPGEVERKMEELIWLSSLFYGVGGLTPNGFQADFFLCVTLVDVEQLN